MPSSPNGYGNSLRSCTSGGSNPLGGTTMPVDFALRRRQLDALDREIRLAVYTAIDRHGVDVGDDPHIVAHYFSGYVYPRSIVEYLTDIDRVLIPNLRQSPEWSLLIPEIERVIAPIRIMDPYPRFGCRFCTY